MKSINKKFGSLLLVFFFLSCDTIQADDSGKVTTQNEKKKSKKAKSPKEAASAAVKVIQKWEVPTILREVSGIAFLGKDQFACVQDEAGVIFIYNINTNKIDKQITFGAAGDYEGIAIVGRTAYVVRSDGKIFEVNNIDAPSPDINEYTTPLTAKNNVEGLTYDEKNNRLLLAIKGAETGTKDYKGIYAFDLKAKKLVAEPVFRLNFKDPLLANYKGKNPTNALQPAEIAIHPTTGAIYITEATNPQLFVLNADGTIQSRHKLDDKVFSQPEGITFSPSGELYISNEGKKENGNILKVLLQ